MTAKWLELLKEIAPRVTRVAVLRDRGSADGIGQFGAIQAVAPSFGVALNPVDVRDAGEIERAITAFVRAPDSGLIVTASGLAISHRNLIVTLAARHKLPVVYPYRLLRRWRRPDLLRARSSRPVPPRRRLRRPHPQGREAGRPAGAGADQYETVINLKTAKALGLDVPTTVLATRRRGDRVIITGRLLWLHELVPGTKRRKPRRRVYVSFWGGSGSAWTDGLGCLRR